ncbi:PAS domain-containing protein [Paracoccus sp. Z330]|uniref:PAS domain-containing protein n=1 Tax=Paracoccus onchidii TaxID=3017813 RepID=A0ABT4ZFT4_9RHOB|nr:PAS domain-containing protein [Paracoccus onchidii]MDB6177833.1 PAS domain-containing protein [Paracoccus onchidii]
MSDTKGKDNSQSQMQPASAPGQLFRIADFDRNQPRRLMLEMREYWQSLRNGRAVPARSDVEPRGIHRVLDYAFILERIAPGAARFRLAGRHLIDLMGMEVRGMPACSFIKPTSRGRFSDVLESVFKAPQIAEMGLDAPGEYARPAMQARMMLLPLRSDLGDVTRALGCLISEGETGVAPRRFDLVEDEVSPIIDGGTTLRPSPSSFGMAEQQRDFRPAIRPDQGAAPDAPQTSKAAPKEPNATPEQRRASFRVISSDKD